MNLNPKDLADRKRLEKTMEARVQELRQKGLPLNRIFGRGQWSGAAAGVVNGMLTAPKSFHSFFSKGHREVTEAALLGMLLGGLGFDECIVPELSPPTSEAISLIAFAVKRYEREIGKSIAPSEEVEISVRQSLAVALCEADAGPIQGFFDQFCEDH